MAEQPILQQLDRVSFNVLVDGSEIPGVFIVQSLEITYEVNRIAHSKLVLKDGNASEQTFTISESGNMEPGAEIKINLTAPAIGDRLVACGELVEAEDGGLGVRITELVDGGNG